MCVIIDITSRLNVKNNLLLIKKGKNMNFFLKQLVTAFRTPKIDPEPETSFADQLTEIVEQAFSKKYLQDLAVFDTEIDDINEAYTKFIKNLVEKIPEQSNQMELSLLIEHQIDELASKKEKIDNLVDSKGVKNEQDLLSQEMDDIMKENKLKNVKVENVVSKTPHNDIRDFRQKEEPGIFR